LRTSWADRRRSSRRLVRGSGLLVGRVKDKAMQEHGMKARVIQWPASRTSSVEAGLELDWL
jgi:hypothetical protein